MSGNYPSNSKGGLPAPEARTCAQEGGVEAELTQPLASQRAHKTKQNQGSRVDSVPRWLREERDPGDLTEKEARVRVTPKSLTRLRKYR